MTTLGHQFGGYGGVPRPRGGSHGGPTRRPDALDHHPEHGKIGSLSAVARELGMNPSALHMQRKRRSDFPGPILGSTYAVKAVSAFRSQVRNSDEPDFDEDDI